MKIPRPSASVERKTERSKVTVTQMCGLLAGCKRQAIARSALREKAAACVLPIFINLHGEVSAGDGLQR